MKIKLAIIIIFLSAISSYTQDIGSLSYIHELGKKETATFGDAVSMFVLTLNKKAENFNTNISILKSLNVIPETDYSESTPLRRGMLASIIAKYLDLKDSLFYRIFKSERYAFRACIADNIMDANMSEWDKISGDELIEIMSIVAEKKGEEK